MNVRGFSLIEIIVAVGVFTVVAMLTVGSLFILTSAEKRVAGVQANQDNIRFTMELMSREIRTGDGYYYSIACGPSCFTFRLTGGETIVYRLVGNKITRQVDSDPAHPVTGPEVSIEKLEFSLAGEDPYSDDVQPHLTIALEGIAQKDTPNETVLNVQTSVTPLLLNQ